MREIFYNMDTGIDNCIDSINRALRVIPLNVGGGWAWIFSAIPALWVILIFLQISLCTKIILKKVKSPIFEILLIEYGIGNY